MKRKIVIPLLTVLLIQTFVCSCTYYAEDPFLTETENGGSTGEVTGEVTEETTENTGGSFYSERNIRYPDADFYTLSTSEAYEKYGILSTSNTTNQEYSFDGKYKYVFYSVQTLDGRNITTLDKFEYPFGKMFSPVCTDPLCMHNISTCPFSVCAGGHGDAVCFGDKIFIAARYGGGFYMYDKYKNKTELLIPRTYAPLIYRHDGELYLTYNEENKDLDTNKVFVKISEDGEVTELGRLSDFSSQHVVPYKDRYAIDYEPVLYDGGYTLNIISRDLQTKDVKKIAEYDCAGAVEYDYTETYAIYGSKLLIYFCYNLKHYPEQDKRQVGMLIDLETGESRVLCTPDYYTYKQSYVCFMFSSKCIVWFEPKPKKDDPMIVHIYFPYEDKEDVYDFSELVKEATGDDLPRYCSLIILTNGALSIMREPKDFNDSDPRIYDVDLASGRVYKYDVPQNLN